MTGYLVVDMVSRAVNLVESPAKVGLSLAMPNDTADRKLPPALRVTATTVGCPPLSERGESLSLECPPSGSNVRADELSG